MSHPVDDDVVMASAIGRCSNAWTHLETILARIFMHLTGMDFTMAVTVFSFFKATRTQRAVMSKLSKLSTLMSKAMRDQLLDKLKTYQSLADRRNELLHNPIGRSVENEVYIMLRGAASDTGKIPYHQKPIAPEEIDEIADQIRTLIRSLLEFEMVLMTQRRSGTTAQSA